MKLPEAVWNEWAKRLDLSIATRWPAIKAETYFCIFEQRYVTNFTNADGTELDRESAIMVKTFIEGFITAQQQAMDIVEKMPPEPGAKPKKEFKGTVPKNTKGPKAKETRDVQPELPSE